MRLVIIIITIIIINLPSILSALSGHTTLDSSAIRSGPSMPTKCPAMSRNIVDSIIIATAHQEYIFLLQTSHLMCSLNCFESNS